jgi:hypothetical protein
MRNTVSNKDACHLAIPGAPEVDLLRHRGKWDVILVLLYYHYVFTSATRAESLLFESEALSTSL